MKVPSQSMKLNVNKKEEQKSLHILANGWNSKLNIPEFKEFSIGGIVPEDYFKVFGSNEFFINPKTKNFDKKSKIRIAEPGIVFEKGTVDNKELRLPWQNILNVQYKGKRIILDLIYDQSLEFYGIPFYRDIKYSLKFLTNFIKDKVKQSKI
ncbi:hypothetical protein [Methanobrevibacter curvatus]|uniref:Uncharacterized protein n=1 Tax=Methanobrevibacter curvatus TaxID=49547 RepID=A0A166C5L7_9EURY|nr:hypothetical protein [Methanobrevibacter curvatus]KZX14153.1 hypothetical protein MBCUR_06290 [Methanobrevibacter curvatus]